MELDSDSDSDLEFLAGQTISQHSHEANAQLASDNVASRKSHSTADPADSTGRARPEAHAGGELQAQVENLRRDMWEKLGENVILRSQLENTAGNHQRELGELINKHARAKEEFRQELEKQKKELEKERIQMQFLQAELRSKVGVSSADAAGAGSGAGAGAAVQARQSNRMLPPGKRPSLAAGLSEGFLLKKQRIHPSLDASQSNSQPAGPSQAGSTQSAAEPQTIDRYALFALIATHHAPGYTKPTLELLFKYQLPSGESVGQKLSVFESFSELVDLILEIVDVKSQDDDCITILLALLYALCIRRMDLGETQRRVLPASLCTNLLKWLKLLSPLPEFGSILPPYTLPLIDLRLLTCILYTLDILASLEYEFPISHGLGRRLLTCSQAPQVVGKAISLLCLQPQSVDAELVKLMNPTSTFKPTIELLFSGLIDAVPLLTVAQICTELPSSPKSCRLAPTGTKIAQLKRMSQQQAQNLAHSVQSACIQLALALQYDRATAPISMHSQVLAILTGHIDCPFPFNNQIVQESVFFFWCHEPTKLRDELNEDELGELEVCLSKLVYAASGSNESVDRGRQLLQALAGGTDSDQVFEAFEPMGHERRSSRVLHQQSTV